MVEMDPTALSKVGICSGGKYVRSATVITGQYVVIGPNPITVVFLEASDSSLVA